MQWKMNENSLFAILLRSPWWMSAALAAALGGVAAAVMPPSWRVFGALTAAPFAVIAVIALARQIRAPSARRVAATLEAVRAMPWTAFADALELGFRLDGYEVTRLPGPGADFEIAKEGRRTLVSGKRWKAARIGVEPVKDLVAEREARELSDAILVVAGELSEQARALASQKRVRIYGGAELASLLPDAGRKAR